jgi:hypothetical protein
MPPVFVILLAVSGCATSGRAAIERLRDERSRIYSVEAVAKKGLRGSHEIKIQISFSAVSAWQGQARNVSIIWCGLNQINDL